jgi:hypothetical protein
VWPERSVEIHGRYGVKNEAAYNELVLSWHRQLTAAPTMLARAESMRVTYREQARAMRARSG